MASKSTKVSTREPTSVRHSRLPQDQQDEADKDGRCRRILCSLFQLRVLTYMFSQPASCTFIVSLFLIAVTLPILGTIVKDKELLPDLDAMKNWNSYLGKLNQNSLCFRAQDPVLKTSPRTFSRTFNDSTLTKCAEYEDRNLNASYRTVGVMLNFTVNRTLFDDKSPIALYSEMNGSDIGTQIKSHPGRKRIDGDIGIHFWIDLSLIKLAPIAPNDTSVCNKDECRISGCVLITAPTNAVPTRLPQVHKNFDFQSKIINSTRHPEQAMMCNCSYFNLTSSKLTGYKVVEKRPKEECQSDDQKSQLNLIRSNKGNTKGYGVIKIYLEDDDKIIVSKHMYLAALIVAALGVAFTIGIFFTDRPSVPKTSQE